MYPSDDEEPEQESDDEYRDDADDEGADEGSDAIFGRDVSTSNDAHDGQVCWTTVMSGRRWTGA